MAIFLSYTPSNIKQAQPILDALQQAGCPATDRIENARCFLAIVTENYPYSTMLAQQAIDAAWLYRERRSLKLFIYNLEGRRLWPAFQFFLEVAEVLPADAGQAVAVIVGIVYPGNWTGE